MANVAVIYHQYPHYRAPVLRELTRNGTNDYVFWGSVQEVEGIKPFRGDEVVTIHPLQFALRGRWWSLGGFWGVVFDRKVDALIVLGNPNMPATWLMSIAARLVGKKVLFWTHGWLRWESGPKTLLRRTYNLLANRLLVYGERARELGAANGYPPERIDVVYNSLDYDRAQLALREIEGAGQDVDEGPQALFAQPWLPLIICTARLTVLCRFDLLFEAASQLATRGQPVNIVLVGDGPERKPLEALAERLGINVVFYGACYDESVLARLIYHADLTVSPGKIGLTVIHSLTYGTASITHGDMDEQMPEVEAILPGRTGLLFERNNPASLAAAIEQWLALQLPREQVRRDCMAVIAEKWNPQRQRELIDAAVDKLFPGSRK